LAPQEKPCPLASSPLLQTSPQTYYIYILGRTSELATLVVVPEGLASRLAFGSPNLKWTRCFSSANWAKNKKCWAKPFYFAEPNRTEPSCFDFSSSNLNWMCGVTYILSTAGDALTTVSLSSRLLGVSWSPEFRKQGKIKYIIIIII
jgi:hypothetical protein